MSRAYRGPITIASRALISALALALSLSACGTSSTDLLQSGLGSSEQKSAPANIAPASGPAAPNKVAASAAVSSSVQTDKTVEKAVESLTASATPGNTGYLIGPADVLDVSVFKVPELTKTVQVAETGLINLPLVGDVPAAGKTSQQLERDLNHQLGAKYLQKPQVTVLVKEYNSQRVTMDGAVKKPGVYPLRGQTTLLQLVALAEGPSEVSDSTLVVIRNTDGKRSAAKFNIDDIRSGAMTDPRLQPGDVVVAPSSTMKEAWNNILKALPIAGVFAAVL